MRRSVGLYLAERLGSHEPGRPGVDSSQSVDALVRASMQLRQTLKSTECVDQKMVLHTQLDKLERQLLKQLGYQAPGKTNR